MAEIYEFSGHRYELDIERKDKIKCKVWEPKKDNSSVVIFAYGYGENSYSREIEQLAESIVKNDNAAVVVVEYAGTDLKYSDDLIKNLEEILPSFLDNIAEYVPENIKAFIEKKQYQDAINGLYFNAFAKYPITRKTVIPLYGDSNKYNDFGMTPALDIIYSIVYLQKVYTNWNWNDCIGYGKDYGAYLIEMVERLQPGTFSMILNVQGNLFPKKEDLFYNLTEWEAGGQKNAHIKRIGRFPVYLVDVQGWTTKEGHSNHFKPWHFDIRNLLNETIISSNFADKETPRIYVDLYNLNKEYLGKRKLYIDRLIEKGYSVEYFIVEESDIDHDIFDASNDVINIDLYKLFSYYFGGYCGRNKKEIIPKRLLWYPVYGGVYLIYGEQGLPRISYLNKNDVGIEEYKRTFEIIRSSDEYEQILEYIEKPIENIDKIYIELLC